MTQLCSLGDIWIWHSTRSTALVQASTAFRTIVSLHSCPVYCRLHSFGAVLCIVGRIFTLDFFHGKDEPFFGSLEAPAAHSSLVEGL